MSVGGAFLFLILSFGQYLATSIAYFERKDKYRESPYDSDSEEDEDLPRGKRILKKLFCCFSCSRSVTLLLKAFTLIGSFGMIGISCGWLFMMTRQFNFTLYSSSLISSALTFFVLLVTSSFLMAQSSSIISDPACILLYLVYNIWIILRDEKSASSSLLPSSLVWPTDPWNFQFSAFPLGYELITTNLVDFVHSYTVEIILNLLFRITIYLLSSKMVAKFHEQILEKESSKFGPIILSDRSPPFNEHLLSGEEELTITDLLYAFGKCAMILLYTFSWLESHETSSFYTYHLFSNTSMALVPWRPAYWRWINIYWVLLLYFWHLYTQN